MNKKLSILMLFLMIPGLAFGMRASRARGGRGDLNRLETAISAYRTIRSNYKENGGNEDNVVTAAIKLSQDYPQWIAIDVNHKVFKKIPAIDGSITFRAI